MTLAAMIGLAALIDTVLGWPTWLYQRIGHPVTWLGRLITRAETRLNHGTRAQRLAGGALTVGLCLVAAGLPAFVATTLLPDGWSGILIAAILAWPLIAIRSMHDHLRDVAVPLSGADLATARVAVSMIVGRDPSQLDENGISRAAVESLAENTSDGIVAPVFWGVVAGLPGIAIYKAINTMDSMIGHRTERYEAFGKVAARLDDAVNWIPARLTGLLFALASFRRVAVSLRTMIRDASAHRSPNAGWPEAAMAGALGMRLSGPRVYGTKVVDEPWLNADAPDLGANALSAALGLYRRAIVLMMLALLMLSLL